jgi:CheY-specific phosphatase CheX
VKTTQQVLFARPVGPGLAQLAHGLKQLEMGVTVAPTFEAARRIAQGMPSLALVVIDAEREPDAAKALLLQIKDRDLRLPVLWVGAAPSGSAITPDVCLPADSPSEHLTERAQALLADDLYPPALVRSLVSACNTALVTTFECSVECAEPRLSRSAVRPGDVSSLMFVADENTSAHFILSSSEAALFSLAERIGFDASEGRRRLAIDMASELTNQIMGRMKASTEALANVRLGLPYVLTGEQLCIYAPTPKPSLVVQIDIGTALLTVDFWFKTRVQPDRETERFMAELSAGDGLF